MISLIAAIGKNNELGKGNTLLFNIPADLKHFRDITRGHSVIMGRKTFESLPNGALPNRRNIVITRDTEYNKDLPAEQAGNIEIVHSLEQALKLFENTDEEIFIIGGAEIYKQAISITDKLYITHIEAEDKDADSYFPSIDKEIWKIKNREDFSADEKNIFDYSFVEYIKT